MASTITPSDNLAALEGRIEQLLPDVEERLAKEGLPFLRETFANLHDVAVELKKQYEACGPDAKQHYDDVAAVSITLHIVPLQQGIRAMERGEAYNRTALSRHLITLGFAVHDLQTAYKRSYGA